MQLTMIPASYGEWIDLVYRRRRTAIGSALIIFGLIAVGTLVWPPVYASTCQVLVQDNRAQLLVSPGMQGSAQQGPSAISNPVSEQDLNSERELITSEYLVKQVVADMPVPPAFTRKPEMALAMIKGVIKLPITGYRALHDVPHQSPKDAWATDIARNLDASVIKRSNIIEVEFHSSDRAWTKTLLDRLMSKYLDFHAYLSHDPEAQQFFEEQASILKSRLDKSDDELRDYQLKTGIGDLEEQKHALITRISDLEAQATSEAANISGTEQQLAMFTSELQTTPVRIQKESRSEQNMALSQLKPQVMQLRAEKAELLSRYQPNSQRITEINAKLASEESILDSENHLEVNEETVDSNPVWITIQTAMMQATSDVAAEKAKRAQYAVDIAAAKQQLAALVSNGVDLQHLQRQVNTDQSAYAIYVQKTEEARTSEALNNNKLMNVSVAQPPNAPLQPQSPNVPLNLCVGLLMAGAFGLAAACWEEERDPRIFSSGAVNAASGLTIIGVVDEST
jgi:uncharacterized protein involved in exopolysaccharide biosynthesis